MNTTPEQPRTFALTARLFIGILLTLLGLLLGLDQLALPGLPNHFFVRLWPLALVGAGAFKLKRRETDSPAPYILIVAGLLLLAMNFGRGHVLGLIWPMLIVTAGIFVILHALNGHRRVPPELRASQDFLRGTAILSGFKQRVVSQAFKGGELTAMFGGFEADLRQAAMEGDTARLDVFVLFGGGEIRVPPGWEVSIQASAIAGAVENKTLPTAQIQEGRPRLIITGQAFFGGVEIKD